MMLKPMSCSQRGETVGIFQYESPGMQKYMKDLKPTVFADLIAMNALYRPGYHWNIFRLSFVEKMEKNQFLRFRCLKNIWRNLWNYRLPRAGDAFVAKIS